MSQQQQQQQERSAETKVSIGGLLATEVYSRFHAITDQYKFHQSLASAVHFYAKEAAEHRTHDCYNHKMCLQMVVLLTEVLCKAYATAGNGAAFATVRSHFLDLLDSAFRKYAEIHTYPVSEEEAAQMRAAAGRPPKEH